MTAHARTLCFLLLSFAGCTAAVDPVEPTQPPSPVPLSAAVPVTPMTPVALHPKLEASFSQWEGLGPTGDPTHREKLQKLAETVRTQLSAAGSADLLFVCTHNSRRSHISQILALAAAKRVGLSTIQTFSGGTEATAFNPRAIAALQRVGVEIAPAEGKNPIYPVSISPGLKPTNAFSKKMDDSSNPSKGFVAVMTCSQADASCPYVPGAAARVAVPYEDPKVADNTPEETARYDERVAQIGRDMAWVFAQVAKR
ncbi:MAG: protein-tyrosine-phosphatase [Polyangiaceae bacterium]|nr:protein-tyrosine-phosphatase [Polyangiaceae bacterium]